MKKTYTDYEKEYKDEGKDTGTETKTEQDYLPIAVQVQRFMDAGEILAVQKQSLFDIGWDENFHINKAQMHPERGPNFGMVEAQEELEGANERLQKHVNNTRQTKADKDADDEYEEREQERKREEQEPEPVPEPKKQGKKKKETQEEEEKGVT